MKCFSRLWAWLFGQRKEIQLSLPYLDTEYTPPAVEPGLLKEPMVIKESWVFAEGVEPPKLPETTIYAVKKKSH